MYKKIILAINLNIIFLVILQEFILYNFKFAIYFFDIL